MERSSRGWNPVWATEGAAYKFSQYLKSKQYAEYSIYRTLGYVHTMLVNNVVKEATGKKDIYEVKEIEQLGVIVRQLMKTEQDIKSHHMYSAAVRRYIKFIEICN